MELLTTLQWILVALFVGPTFYYGYVKMIAEPAKIKKFSAWGYPIKIMQVIGVVEIIGAVSILFPELRLAGIAIWTVILTGAVFTNILHREPKKELFTVLTVLAHLTLILALNVWLSTTIK
ncbi:DoxX family protein [Emticicia sp. BO119]|uniref:DoxX family protein n=1 Tax=Emticicia sp. BO119 TaxID=2757768 RepID=UPI0015F0BD2D|nr:DoxX family protein [Emticicia sp. BO119]MBA4851899.1 DoxX family protein [Emticicia sp. BO119]